MGCCRARVWSRGPLQNISCHLRIQLIGSARGAYPTRPQVVLAGAGALRRAEFRQFHGTQRRHVCSVRAYISHRPSVVSDILSRILAAGARHSWSTPFSTTRIDSTTDTISRHISTRSTSRLKAVPLLLPWPIYYAILLPPSFLSWAYRSHSALFSEQKISRSHGSYKRTHLLPSTKCAHRRFVHDFTMCRTRATDQSHQPTPVLPVVPLAAATDTASIVHFPWSCDSSHCGMGAQSSESMMAKECGLQCADSEVMCARIGRGCGSRKPIASKCWVMQATLRSGQAQLSFSSSTVGCSPRSSGGISPSRSRYRRVHNKHGRRFASMYRVTLTFPTSCVLAVPSLLSTSSDYASRVPFPSSPVAVSRGAR